MRRPLCFFCLLFAFFIWLSLAISPPAAPDYSCHDKSSVCLIGTVASKEYKRKKDDSLQLYVTLNNVTLNNATSNNVTSNNATLNNVTSNNVTPNNETFLSVPAHYSVLCVFSDSASSSFDFLNALDSSLPIGSTATLWGTLRSFSPATNPGEFDAACYYQILRYAFRLQEAKLLGNPVHSINQMDHLSDALYHLKRRLSRILDETLPAEDAGIMKAMLLGEKGFLSEEIKDLYQESGIVHIIAISGLHISFLGMGLWRLFRKLRVPGPFAGSVCICLILLYGQMTGTGVSSLRAIIMFGLQILADLMDRTYDLLSAVSLAGILLLIEQPLYLWHSGFLFSFAAVLSIGLLMPILPGKGAKTIAIPLGSLPIYLLFYHSFPVASLFLNLIVIPMMGFLLPFGILLLLLGLFTIALGTLAGFPVRGILFVYKLLCKAGSLLPISDLMPGAPNTASVFLYLGFLLFLIFAQKYFSDLCKYLWVSCAVLLLCLHPTYPLEITFLDVGQGDGIFINCQGKTILIDGGSSSTTSLADYQLTPHLTWAGTDRIDLAILTHDDSDHCNGLIDLLTADDIKICHLLLPAIDASCQGENYQQLQALCQKKNIPVLYGARGEQLQIGDVNLQILHPEADACYEDSNAYSMTILLTYQAFSALFTGDLEREGEQNFLTYMQSEYCQNPDIFPPTMAIKDDFPSSSASSAVVSSSHARRDDSACVFPYAPLTILKVAHHGSRYATSGELLTFFSPRIGIISAGRSNRYGHPASETLERLEDAGVTLYSTQTNGAITVKTDGKKVFIETFLSADSINKD